MNRRSVSMAIAILLVAALATGCDPNLNGLNPPNTAGTNFATASLITYDANNRANLSGTVQGDEVDVFDLGAMSTGDRIIISVNADIGSPLDPTIAVFDGAEEVFAVNDDVDLQGRNFNSAVDDFVAVADDHYYLAVTRYVDALDGGSYNASVEIVRGGQIPERPTQFLLLNFAGGQFTINGQGSFNLDPFDAADIDADYAGQTVAVKSRILETVQENFAGTGLVIHSSDENPNLDGCTFSTIHFGAFTGDKFGVADDVDGGNKDRCDNGIVFTDQFDDPFAVQPTTAGIGVAIGNVASHEAGHLLGLNHVADISALMDNTGSASTLLADQDFKSAPLSRSIFPFGDQNDVKLLNRVIP
ncbi:MAG TPA: matrixin family metalloprotease [Phycisphaerae bacterium]|nr:matrixin family metalloprotease [Phycisphaerae bacterium]